MQETLFSAGHRARATFRKTPTYLYLFELLFVLFREEFLASTLGWSPTGSLDRWSLLDPSPLVMSTHIFVASLAVSVRQKGTCQRVVLFRATEASWIDSPTGSARWNSFESFPGN